MSAELVMMPKLLIGGRRRVQASIGWHPLAVLLFAEVALPLTLIVLAIVPGPIPKGQGHFFRVANRGTAPAIGVPARRKLIRLPEKLGRGGSDWIPLLPSGANSKTGLHSLTRVSLLETMHRSSA